MSQKHGMWHELYNPLMYVKVWFKHIFIDTQTSKDLMQMDVNKMMANGIFPVNGKHTQFESLKRIQHLYQ